jgi:hypothetical protein
MACVQAIADHFPNLWVNDHSSITNQKEQTMDKIQAFIAANVTGQNIYYPVKVEGFNPETKAYQSFRVEASHKWALRKLMEQAGFLHVSFD